MRVLVIGAYGFIGAPIAGALRTDGHEVVACGRDIVFGRRLFPDLDWVACDFNTDLSPEDWRPRLDGIAAVVNCVGILQDTRRDSAKRIHHQAPAALFAACRDGGVRRMIQISALGAEPAAATVYAATKTAGDTTLRETELNWVILKPSLVYGRGSYGGTSLLRGLAGLPGVIPLVDGGEQRFQPVSIDDLAGVVVDMLAPDAPSRLDIAVVGPEVMTVREIVLLYRQWLGFRPARVVSMPAAVAFELARYGDMTGWLGTATPLRRTALAQMIHGSIVTPEDSLRTLPAQPKAMPDVFADNPSTVQDRWHARLFFLKPLLRAALAIFWLATGLVTLLPAGAIEMRGLVTALGLSHTSAAIVVSISAILDVILGLLLLVRYRVVAVGLLQIAIMILYVLVLTFAAPALWADPMGSLVKVAPLVAATLVMVAIEHER